MATTLILVVAANLLRSPAVTSAVIARGSAAPEIRGTTLDGQPFDLASLRGRPVIVNFWGPSCIPCRDEFPLLEQELASHAGEGLAVVGVLTDDPPDPARDFVAKYGGTWPTVQDPGGAIKATYRVAARPQSYFIDRSGVLREIQVGQITEADFARLYPSISGASPEPSGP